MSVKRFAGKLVLSLALAGLCLTLVLAAVHAARTDSDDSRSSPQASPQTERDRAADSRSAVPISPAPVHKTETGIRIESALPQETVAATDVEAASKELEEKADLSARRVQADEAGSAAHFNSILLDGSPESQALAVSLGAAFTPEIGQNLIPEVEPNNTAATATPLGSNAVGIGNVPPPGGDIDFWSFPASAGDRVYAATQTSFSASGTTTRLEVIASDGTTVLEFDTADGSFAAGSSSIAGTVIPADGTYYLSVRNTSSTAHLRPYYLHLRVQSGAPTAESEPNDTTAQANPLPANGWVRGTRDPALATEQDWYSLSLNAGDTVYLSLDLDPERDNLPGPGGWNGRVGIGLFGDAGNFYLIADDTSTGSATNPLSEALFMTVKQAGTYYAAVEAASATTGGPTHTYHLSVSVRPATAVGINCATYTSTDVPQTIPTGTGPLVVNSTIVVPGNPRIADVDVSVTLNHALMADLDVELISPGGNEVGLFTDIGATAVSGQAQMDTTYDEQAGIPPAYTVLRGLQFQPELAYRLNWFNGMNGGGTWTLRIRDDVPATNGGTLTGWSLTICEEPPDPPCPPGRVPIVIYQSDFEANDGGFTVSGPSPAPWQHGTPTASVINTCNSGTQCWKTNLTGDYNASSNQDLISPPIDLTTPGLVGPVRLELWRKYHLETASFDRFFGEVREVGGANPRRLFEFLDATMRESVGSPTTTVNYSAGWGRFAADITPYLGTMAELRINFVSDSSVNLNGIAIDDVRVTACFGCSLDPDCDDGNPCTNDVCEGGNCVYSNVADGTDCNDNNACTSTDVCTSGTCAGTTISCDDSNACTADSCNPASGCVNTPIVCDDANICTTDSCDPASGCIFAPNTIPCNDNNACTTNDICAGGLCVGGPPPNCDDGNVCTTDSCSPAVGCVNLNNTLPCDDGDACTTDDVCGAPGGCNPAENFDSVTPPALPAGWTQTVIIGTPADGWSTVTTQSDTPPNSAFTNDPAVVTDKVLDSPSISIISPSAKVGFRTRFDLEAGYDGGVLEISIGGGAFQGILAAGGSFAEGGYTHTISTAWGSPIAGRQAWSGISGGGATPVWRTVTVNLPAAAGGQTIVLRWRVATDTSIARTGQWIDSIVVNDPGCIHVCLPGAPVNCDDGDPCTVDTCDPSTGGCVNNPGLPPGSDSFPSTGKIIVEGLAPFLPPVREIIPLSSQGLPDSLVVRGAQAGDTIPIELVALNLTGVAPTLGPVQVEESPVRSSIGLIENAVVTPTCEFVSGDSFFDIFARVTVGGLTLENVDPLRVQAHIGELPPRNREYENPFLQPIFLYDPASPPPGGAPRARILYEIHHADPDFPPPGQDCFDTTLDAFLQTFPPLPPFSGPIRATGPTEVLRQAPTPRPLETIDIEMVSLSLRGTAPILGPISINRSHLQPTLGRIIGDPGPFAYSPQGARSFFDVFFTIEGDFGQVMNRPDEPARVSADPGLGNPLRIVPPGAEQTYKQQPGQFTTLYDPGLTTAVGRIENIVHRIDRPRSWQPPPPPGDDCFQSWVVLRITLYDPYWPGGCVETVRLPGPFRVLRGAPSDPGDGRDLIKTILACAQFVGGSPLCGGALQVRPSSSLPSLGEIQSIAPDEVFPADSFFDVFVNLDSGIGPLHTSAPSRMTTTINAIPPPPGEIYYGPGTVIPLYNAAGVLIGEILEVSHEIKSSAICPCECGPEIRFRTKTTLDVGIPGGGAGVLYDVVRGTISGTAHTAAHWATSFGAAVCISPVGKPRVITDPLVPAPNVLQWYLSRDVFEAYRGTWNSCLAQVGDRDPLVPNCP